MANDGDAPGTTQDFLPLHPTHVVDVGVVFGEAEDPTRSQRRQISPDSKDVCNGRRERLGLKPRV